MCLPEALSLPSTEVAFTPNRKLRGNPLSPSISASSTSPNFAIHYAQGMKRFGNPARQLGPTYPRHMDYLYPPGSKALWAFCFTRS